jgi:hypothetical protein
VSEKCKWLHKWIKVEPIGDNCSQTINTFAKITLRKRPNATISQPSQIISHHQRPTTRDGGLIGSKSNKARSDENQAQIQRVLEARPETISMTCPEIALFLNELGVANENGRANDGPVLWTPTTLRRKLGRARNAINAISKGL